MTIQYAGMRDWVVQGRRQVENKPLQEGHQTSVGQEMEKYLRSKEEGSRSV